MNELKLLFSLSCNSCSTQCPFNTSHIVCFNHTNIKQNETKKKDFKKNDN